MTSFRFHPQADLPAALVVFLVALPLCLGIALGSGAPLLSGIVAGVGGGVVVGALSGSPLSVSGPAAGLTAVVLAAIAELGAFETFLAAVVLAGVLQVVLGLLRLGVVGHYVPNTVIKGMMAAIGIILILKQIPHLVGYDADFFGDEGFNQADHDNTFTALLHAMGSLSPGAAVVGFAALAWLQLADFMGYGKTQIGRIVPSALVAVVGGTLLATVLPQVLGPIWDVSAGHRVQLPALSLSGWPTPDWTALQSPAVWTTGVTLALIASLESLLSIEAADRLDPLKRVTPTNRELLAQGAGNVVSGALGGLPVTSVVVRTSVNAQAGAQSRWSAIAHGVLLALSVVLLTAWLNQIPLATLAAILIATGYKLTDPKKIIAPLVRQGIMQWLPFAVTVVAILLSDLLKGIAVGLLVATVFIALNDFRSSISLTHLGANYILQLRRNASFLNKGALKASLEKIPAGAELLVDLTQADFIDPDLVEVIRDFAAHSALKNITVSVRQSPHQNYLNDL
ncbi:MAG: SulP family inorganic anion transporter [Schleiferiaceae bacterium]